MNKNDSKLIYKFPDIDDSKLIKKLSADSDKVRAQKILASNIKPSDVSIGGKFDLKAFNNKLDKIKELRQRESKLKDQINLAKLQYRPVSYNHLTIDQLKHGMIMDIYDMFNELALIDNLSIKNINLIMSKNYRKITLLILLLLYIVISYIIISILSDD
jgi:hypothetical protein